uniref:Tubulin-specific chaperone A n=1 Tax=Magallana gigas TaxID=29159 RepID=K1RFW6_MAGGI|nr:tubulin-specific chaperone A [Crassostrea gigas]|eukprot:XP_011436383.1 PREDICTED: tubulin-specific chaperone A [Crassostrea gigas]
MADPRVKQIKIKTGVVKRLTKEKVSYEKEAVKIEEKVEQMKADKKDEYEIKKMIEVLQESKMMIPDTLKRLNNAYADLDTLLTKEEDLSETEEYKAGKTALEEAKAVMPSS